MNLAKHIQNTIILNINEEISSLSGKQIISTAIDKKSYVASDVDEELLVLIQFIEIVDLCQMKIYALSKSNDWINHQHNDIDISAPKQIHIYKIDHININFSDIVAMTPDVTVKCSSKKLNKGQNIKIKKKAQNAVRFSQVRYLAIYIHSNQNDTENTFINGIVIEGGTKQNSSRVNQIRKQKITFDQTDAKSRQNVGKLNKRYSQFNTSNLFIDSSYLLNRSTTIKVDRELPMTNNYKNKISVFETLNQSHETKVDTDHSDCQISKCLHLNRLRDVLTRYHAFIDRKHQGNDGSLNHICDDKSNLKLIINNFHHLLKVHAVEFEQIYDVLREKSNHDRLCELSSCLMHKRNNRDRESLRMNDIELKRLYFDSNNHNIAMQQILDQIHCYFFHSFDCGYKLSHKQRVRIQQIIDASKRKEDNTVDDQITKLIYDFVKKKIKHKRKRTNSNRFTSPIAGTVEPNYSFGIKYFYWDYYKFNIKTVDDAYDAITKPTAANKGYVLGEFYVKAKYNNLKNELLSNGICVISQTAWNNEATKAMMYLDVDRFKNRVCNFPELTEMQNEHKQDLDNNWLYTEEYKAWMKHTMPVAAWQKLHYGVSEGTQISSSHLIAMMIYCNYDTLQRKFSETYRRVPDNETDKSIIKRHSNYAHLGRLLRECVDLFGDRILYGIPKLYHGISNKVQFKSIVSTINTPLSTTKDFTVAVNFAENKGLIVELSAVGLWFKGSFDCQYLSDFVNEQEMFFVGGYGNFAFVSIIEAPTGNNYKYYIDALNKMIDVLCNAKKCEIRNTEWNLTVQKIGFNIMSHELHTLYPNDACYHEFKSLPSYMETLIKNQFSSITTIHMGCVGINYKNPNYIHDKIAIFEDVFRHLLFYDYGWIKLDVITKLFPNLEKLELGDPIKNDAFVANTSIYLSILSSISDLSISLQEIVISFSSTMKPEVISIANRFKTKFKQLHWILSFQDRYCFVYNVSGVCNMVINKMHIV